MKVLLDEMWTPTIAVELRKLGLDVIASNEPADAGRYAGSSTTTSSFNRHHGDAVIGRMVRALEHFLSAPEAEALPFNRAHYLRLAPDRS